MDIQFSRPSFKRQTNLLKNICENVALVNDLYRLQKTPLQSSAYEYFFTKKENF